MMMQMLPLMAMVDKKDDDNNLLMIMLMGAMQPGSVTVDPVTGLAVNQQSR